MVVTYIINILSFLWTPFILQVIFVSEQNWKGKFCDLISGQSSIVFLLKFLLLKNWYLYFLHLLKNYRKQIGLFCRLNLAICLFLFLPFHLLTLFDWLSSYLFVVSYFQFMNCTASVKSLCCLYDWLTCRFTIDKYTNSGNSREPQTQTDWRTDINGRKRGEGREREI